MKKLLTLLMAVCVVCSLAACGKKVDPNAKSEGTMTYAQYQAAAKGDKVVIEGFVQASQSYWNGATMYLADGDGAYFVYQDSNSEPCISEEDWGKLGFAFGDNAYVGIAEKPVKVHVEGYKSEWSGEVEIVDGVVTILDTEDTYKAEAFEIKDMTSEYEAHKDQLVALKGWTVMSDATYKWDGSGAAGANCDVYFYVSPDGTEANQYQFLVESYLCYEGCDVYNTAVSLKKGNVVDLEGFLYSYNGPQLQATKITIK